MGMLRTNAGDIVILIMHHACTVLQAEISHAFSGPHAAAVQRNSAGRTANFVQPSVR